MNANGVRARTAVVAVVVAALVPLAAGCSRSEPDTAGSTVPTGQATEGASTPGRMTVQENGADLAITDAVAHLDGKGDGRLTLKVRNLDGVPEHLAMVGVPDGGRGTLVGGKHGNGSISTAGILVENGTTLDFGAPGGPQILLNGVQGVTSAHTLPLAVQFGVAGMIHLQARVSAS
ncbi:hypothetical protein K7472_31760 [Streptomyces sp. PTM05]|uniref:Lipoprotein n=1 Tax=Streptantibioticus parmotrematis TaxID=2873249 RepID=A0ABS7R1Q7_9ACTN|nr:hypothetical protein [Streptantibioticus parmotrematis]MBY8889385.1 hypothetical protein [Streptantibioticus parmotrematis]